MSLLRLKSSELTLTPRRTFSRQASIASAPNPANCRWEVPQLLLQRDGKAAPSPFPHTTRFRTHLALAKQLVHMYLIVGLEMRQNHRRHDGWWRESQSKSQRLTRIGLRRFASITFDSKRRVVQQSHARLHNERAKLKEELRSVFPTIILCSFSPGSFPRRGGRRRSLDRDVRRRAARHHTAIWSRPCCFGG